MSDAGREMRVALLAPSRKDAEVSCRILADAGVGCRDCPTLEALCAEIAGGTGVVVLPEEALLRDRAGPLAAALKGQPPWSALPVVLLTSPGRTPDRVARSLAEVGDVTFLRRPFEVAEFLNAVRAALRDRARQYQVRDHLECQARQADALREADRRKDEFLAMLAHELRNPLAPVRNGLSVLELAADNRRLAADTRAMMARQVAHLARLVDDLLDVSRITRGKVELRRDRVDLADAVSRAAEAARPLVDARGHRLTVSLPARPVRVSADLTRMTQVVGNLLNNAAKYAEDGGRIDVTLAEEAGGLAVLRVRDTGVGIAADVLPRVFDLFTQADRTIDRSQGGLGIGLTLVRSLVEMHGGTVEAHSDGHGRGSEFVVRLPALPDDDAAAPRPPAAAARAVPRRVLVVDDNVDAAESLATLLRLTGHEVRTAHAGPEAVEAARAMRPEAALLDIGLPGLDGYELARRLRAEAGGEGLLLVALTGYGQEDDRRRAREAGFDHHLTKPADLDALTAVLAAGR